MNVYADYLTKLKYKRSLKLITRDSPANQIAFNAQSFVNFASNDYLGLTAHPLLRTWAHEYALAYGNGSASSRLITGNLTIHQALEDMLAQYLKKPAALVMGSGYSTNASIIEALLMPMAGEVGVFIDKHCHASIYQGIRSGIALKRFFHNDVTHLEKLLMACSKKHKFIIVESIYSMDGDIADLEKICQLAQAHNAFLYVDDAHSFGVLGENGAGLAAAYADKIDVIMGTFSKGAGCYGAFIGCNAVIKEYLVNTCKALIYSTSPSPPMIGAMAGALSLLPTLNDARAHLRKLCLQLKKIFIKLQIPPATHYIIPWIISDNQKLVQATDFMHQHHIFALPIRSPTVSPKTSRLRFCLNAAMHSEQINYLGEVIEAMKYKFL